MLAAACPLETWGAIVERAAADAVAGDAKAREWLASYLVGRPKQAAPSMLTLAIDEVLAVDRVVLGATSERDRLAITELSRFVRE